MDEKVYMIFLKYDFLDLTIDDYNQIVLELGNSKDLVKDIETKLNDMITKLLSNDERALYVIDNFINKRLIETNSYGNAINNINILLDYFGKFNFNFNPELIIKLLSKNDRMNQFLKIIVTNNNKLINLVNDGILGLFIEIYCSLNNIEISNNKDDNEDNDYPINVSSAYRMYINEIKKFRKLSQEETVELFKRYNQGDMEAKKKLIEHNLRSVSFIANNYIETIIPLLDLIQEGNMGLIRAVENFDVSKGFSFSTYAKWCIRHSMIRYITDNSRLIRVPAYLHERNMKYVNTVRKLRNELNREPTNEEIATEMNVNINWVNYMQTVFVSTISMDMLMDNDNDNKNKYQFQSDYVLEDEVVQDDLVDKVNELMNKCNLSDKEKKVLKYRFGLGGSKIRALTDLAKEMDITREAARQIEARALIKIKNSSYIKEFAIYMDSPDNYYDENGRFDRKKLVQKPSADRSFRLY